jgi:hypothetical protein
VICPFFRIILKLFFKKGREYDISLNLEKCAFMVCSKNILGFIVSKEGKTLYSKKINTLVKMSLPKTPWEIQVFNGMAQYILMFHQKNCLYYGTNHQVTHKN